MAGVIVLDPFQYIVGVGWGGQVIVVIQITAGFQYEVFAYDEEGTIVGGTPGGGPTPDDSLFSFKLRGETIGDAIRPIGNWVKAGRALAHPGGVFVAGSISFLALDQASLDSAEYMNTHFTNLDGEDVSYQEQVNRFYSTFAGSTILITYRDEGPGLLGGLFASERWSKTYTAVDMGPPDYVDLLTGTILFKCEINGAKTASVVMRGNPEEAISFDVQGSAYAATSVFVAKPDGTVNVFVNEFDEEMAVAKWSGQGGSITQFGDEVSFDAKGSI